MTRLLAIFVFLLAPAWPALIDRIAIVVDGHVIKDSDIDREIRVTDFLNGERLSFGAAERKRAAQRLIDQSLIRREIDAGRYPEATGEETAALFQQAVKSKQPLASYGITETQLRRALHWQLTVLRFIDLRFKPQTQLGVKDPFETWLDQARQAVRIEYHEEDLK